MLCLGLRRVLYARCGRLFSARRQCKGLRISASSTNTNITSTRCRKHVNLEKTKNSDLWTTQPITVSPSSRPSWTQNICMKECLLGTQYILNGSLQFYKTGQQRSYCLYSIVLYCIAESKLLFVGGCLRCQLTCYVLMAKPGDRQWVCVMRQGSIVKCVWNAVLLVMLL